MSLEIAHREREGVTLMDLKGRITMGDEVSAFRAAFEKIAAQPGAQADSEHAGSRLRR